MMWLFLLASILTLIHSTIIQDQRVTQTAVDVSGFQCQQCLSQSSIYYCNTGTLAGCCSGSNFFTDKCAVSLRRSFNCTSFISDSNLRYAQCQYSKTVCGSDDQWLHAKQQKGVVRISNSNKGTQASEGMACSYRIRKDAGDDGQQVVVRIRNIDSLQVFATTVEGISTLGSVVKSQEIKLTGSYRFVIGANQTLMLSLVIKNPANLNVTFEYYSIGQEHYEKGMKYQAIVISSVFLGVYLLLTVTQKCRIINDRHQKEIQEYFQRKELYKQFETDEIFRKNSQFEEVHPLKDGSGPNKAVAGYDTYYRNERGIIKKQAAIKNNRSYMMNQVISNGLVDQERRSNLDRETYQEMQRMMNQPITRQSLSSRAAIPSSLNQLPHLEPIQQYTDRYTGAIPGPHTDYDNTAEELYSQNINRRRGRDDVAMEPTFHQNSGQTLANQQNSHQFQSVDVGSYQNQQQTHTYRENYQNNLREHDHIQPISSSQRSYNHEKNIKIPNAQLQTILKNYSNL